MERIYVMVRVRPLDSPEEAKASPWRINCDSISICNQPTKFEFDRIFGENCRTFDIYEARTKEIVAAAVRGFNGTVFAYGQTNSGKTHTMRGSTAEPGIIPLAVHDLFCIIQEDADREFLLRMSYMEIYNEEINDLLVPEHRKLQIHESLERGIFVAGLREEIVSSPEQVLDFMEFGESHRHIGETNMNLYSSRSHTIFRMIIESREKIKDDNVGNSCDAVRVSVLNLVDLAGSERAAKTGAEGVRLKEGSHINKSLMTLGTVIKKLSEGAESQGGHVPYRDSKLTRILQPALGGNANTAIICNITLAQIHTDETKSSLQFASRALRVTNCAHVNEILTDAALLKRQKKEIEELQEKLQGSHSEHFEEEILNLRNTLLQSELERERIALELQEEKKAHAQRDRRLQEQAKRIANLSSMVLFSKRDDKENYFRKNKRRDTWCPGALLGNSPRKEVSTTPWKAEKPESFEAERDLALPLFGELALETEESMDSLADETMGDFTLPDANALSRVTNRRKVPLEKMSPLLEQNELVEMQTEYEDLLLEFEAQRITKDAEIESLTKRIAEADRKQFSVPLCQQSDSSSRGGKNLTVRESEAIVVIKQLQAQIKVLETEKSSLQSNLDGVVDLATKQNEAAQEKYEGLHQELLDARETATVAHEQLSSVTSIGACEKVKLDFTIELSMEIEGMMLEVQHSRDTVNDFSSVVKDLFQSHYVVSNTLLEFKSFIGQTFTYLKSINDNRQMICRSLSKKVEELEKEKSLLQNQSADLYNQIEELKLNLQNSENSLTERCQVHDLEKAELLSQTLSLQKDISSLSSSSLAREKESLRKELDKTKMKLKDTEFKFKNSIQDKIKLEGEKAYVERELKQLQGQRNLLERNISKRESLADRRRESRASDLGKAKTQMGKVEQSLQLKAVELERMNFDYEILSGDYQKLEARAFEMEEKIASLEEDLLFAIGEKEEALTRNGILASELDAMSNMLNTTNSQLKMLQEEVTNLTTKLRESELFGQKMESSISLLSKEKEEAAMQLTDALLQLEEEKAMWSAKHKAFIESIAEQAQAINELESYKNHCEILKGRLAVSEENAQLEKKCSMEMSLEIDRLRKDFIILETERVQCQDGLKSQIDILSLEHHRACEEAEKLQKQLNAVNEERDKMSLLIKDMDTRFDQSNDCKKNLQDQLLIIADERDKLLAKNEELKMIMIDMQDWKAACAELEILKQNYDDMLSKAKIDIEGLTKRACSLEAKISDDAVKFNRESTKLRMRLIMTQAKLDAFRGRHKEAVDELAFMNSKFEEASAKLKQQLVSSKLENLQLMKQMAAKTSIQVDDR